MSDQPALLGLELHDDVPPRERGPRPGTVGAGARIGAVELSRALGQTHPPTEEQVRVIEAPLAPQLVVAGAGSGKTETMTARVVWLVANGLVAPDEVLGLTFTRKAAGELAERVSARLSALAETGLWTPAEVDSAGARTLAGSPTITTYHSYAGQLVREHALLLGHEREARLLSEAAAWQLAHEAVLAFDGPMGQVEWVESTVTRMVVDLAGEMAEHLREPEEVAEHLATTAARWQAVSQSAKTPLKAVEESITALEQRALVLPVVRRYRELKHARSALDFADQMALAARLAREVPAIGADERSRYRVVLLDEFQDTSEAQLVLMTGLFAPAGREPSAVTAVGDPHQSIYAWRGASATTLATFPERFPGAPVRQLSTSWRNDRSILDAANAVADPLRAGSAVPVHPLRARPGAGQGQVYTARVADAAEEAELLAGWIAERRAGGTLTAAVLCRKRSQFAGVVDALAARGIPYEVVGLGGLLVTSEVADVIALLTVVQDPARGDRLMRLLTGPVCRIGAADVAGLAAWARESGPGRRRGPGIDLARDSRDETTIVDALDALPPPGWRSSRGEHLSERGLARLRELGSVVARLRSLTALPLPDLVAEAERALGVDIEVLARPGWSPGAARAHLDAFADVAAQFAASADRATLGGFVDWVEAAIAQERGLDRPVVDPTPDAVQVLTCHAAKGLEWDVVAVPGLVEGTFPAHRARASVATGTADWRLGTVSDPGWLHGTEGGLPYPLRGDRAGLPELAEHGDSPQAIRDDIAAFKRAGGEQLLTEERRLAYVALTRARRQLLLTSAVWGATGKTPRLPSRFLDEVCALPVTSLGAVPMPDPGTTNPAQEVDRAVLWPHVEPAAERPALVEGRARIDGVPRASPHLPLEPVSDDDAAEGRVVRRPCGARPHDSGGSADDPLDGRAVGGHPLDDEIVLLLREREQARARSAPSVALPAHLSTSALVALAADEADYADRLRRPMPAPPSPEARRGTAFHAWVERHYGSAAIVDVDDLPGRADTAADDPDLPALRARFLGSDWAARVPSEVELSLEVVIAGRAVRGRVDAVFADADGGVTVVDWKTGRPPGPERVDAAALQVSVYRIAYARWRGIPPERVRAALYYGATGETVWPELLDEAAVAAVLTGAGP